MKAAATALCYTSALLSLQHSIQSLLASNPHMLQRAALAIPYVTCYCLAAGESMSAVQDVEDPAEPQRGLSEAEKTERRKVKKARQRAARAQNSAQAMEVRAAKCIACFCSDPCRILIEDCHITAMSGNGAATKDGHNMLSGLISEMTTYPAYSTALLQASSLKSQGIILRHGCSAPYLH